MATRALKAWKRRVDQPVTGWTPRTEETLAFHRAELLGEVQTVDGPMLRVRLTQRDMELENPAQDLAVMIGSLKDMRDAVQELWYWRDAYWMKARDPMSGDWYKDHSYLLYQIQVGAPG